MNLIRNAIEIHLQSGSRESILKSLVSTIRSGAPVEDRLESLLDSDSQAVQKAAVQTAMAAGYEQQIAAVALKTWPPGPGAWNAVATINDSRLTAAQQATRLNWAHRLLTSDCVKLQAANARLICEQLPGLKSELIDHITPLTLRTLCVFAEDYDLSALINALLKRDDAPLPTVLGLALTSGRLVELYEAQPEIAVQLAARHGYTVRVGFPHAAACLRTGITHVNEAMIRCDTEQVRGDVLHVMHEILKAADDVGLETSNRAASDTDDRSWDFQTAEYDRGILYAAARELDMANLDVRRRVSPFDVTLHNDMATDAVRFMHLPESMLRHTLIDDAIALAGQCSVPQQLTSQFILEYTAVALHGTSEERIESELFLRARWQAMAAQQDWTITRFHPERLNQTRRFPDALAIVVPRDKLEIATEHEHRPRLRSSEHERLMSKCADAVARLAEVFRPPERFAELRSTLQNAEASEQRHLSPVGAEVQIPLVNDNRHVAWKEVFRSLGIASRRRPECGKMLEASLPPSASVAAIDGFLRLLLELNVVDQPQDLGIHVSLQGDLADRARYLAFPQLFLNEPVNKAPRARSGLRLVMSKGLVNFNDDVQQCSWWQPATCRTELRVFIAGICKGAEGLLFDEKLIRAIHETHLIGSAMLSTEPGLQQMSVQYQQDLESVVNTFPPEFGRLLAANYYESTGDFQDASLLDYLPMLQLREAVRDVSNAEIVESLRRQLSQLRNTTAEQIQSAIRLGSAS